MALWEVAASNGCVHGRIYVVDGFFLRRLRYRTPHPSIFPAVWFAAVGRRCLKAGVFLYTRDGDEAPWQCIDRATVSFVHVLFCARKIIVLRTVAVVVYPRLCSSGKRGDTFRQPLVGGDALWSSCSDSTRRDQATTR